MGAVYGFTSMLLRVIQDLQPEYVVVAFDRPTPTFRKLLYVGYQANRPSMGVDLSPQFAGVEKVLKAFNIPIFSVDGYEADDVIGTIATQIVAETKKKKDVEVVVVTGDRDLLQLVNSHAKVYMPIKGLTEAKMYNSDDVKEKYGLHPHQIVDMKALMGDPSDNYPGVPGIGPKTASVLLQKYHTLEEIYKHLDELPERQARVLAEGAESAGMGKKLAEIVTDVPITVKLADCHFKVKDKERAVNVLRSFEFKTLTNRFLTLIGEEPRIFEDPPKEPEKIEKKKNDVDQLKLV